MEATEKIAALNPSFMSVTYGAGGGTSKYTTDIATNVKNVNAVELVSKLNENADLLAVCARQLKIRIAQHNVLFPDNKEKNLTKEELDFLADVI